MKSVSEITNNDLINKAISIIHTKKVGDFTMANVGCALLTDKGNIYTGVCIDVSSSMGFCAEHNAIGAMITAGEYNIHKIVAVVKDVDGKAYIYSPCGRCREFIRQINQKNLETEVVLDKNKIVKLKELLPAYDWCQEVND